MLQSKKINHTTDIATRFTCKCSNFKTAAKIKCSHLVWWLIHVFNIEKIDKLLAQIEISCEFFNEANDLLADHLPEVFNQCTSKRRFPSKVKRLFKV